MVTQEAGALPSFDKVCFVARLRSAPNVRKGVPRAGREGMLGTE